MGNFQALHSELVTTEGHVLQDWAKHVPEQGLPMNNYNLSDQLLQHPVMALFLQQVDDSLLHKK